MIDEPFTTSVHIRATPEQVFPYFTDPGLLVRWMGQWADLEPHAGGGFAVDINGIPIRGRYLEVEPPGRLVFTWGAAGSDAHPAGFSTVEITLRADGEGTLLELAHRGLPEAERPQHGIGWAHFLERLAVAGAGGDPGPDPWGEG